jgi:hypothetical protein
MKAWQLDRLGGTSPLMTSPRRKFVRAASWCALRRRRRCRTYVESKLPMYNPPKGAFIPWTNGVGVVHAVGRQPWNALWFGSAAFGRAAPDSPASPVLADCQLLIAVFWWAR